MERVKSTKSIKLNEYLIQEEKSIFFFSGKVNDAKMNYYVYDQEFYAIIKALKNWKHYLIPKESFFCNDHKNLKYFENQHKFN